MSSSGMADVDARHTVDTWRHAKGFTMFAWYGKPTTPSMPQRRVGEPYRKGVNGAHNTVGENVGAYNTARALLCQRGCRVLFSTGVQSTVPGIAV